ncbi:putative RNA-directed DNA polymerase [Rosa chinensis]|uniref:Putative RNA-directed DNA polymerase n=1 Tax=Rosa chinensis TaxID=74649 RepID=A0A2P6P312_ROSCH|nr:putative RNA-directed DNA polymerase [Rosa chinensis]
MKIPLNPSGTLTVVLQTTLPLISPTSTFTMSTRVLIKFLLLMAKDLPSGKVLFHGPCNGSLFPIRLKKSLPQSSTQPSTPSVLFTSASSTTWHKRLGHPSPQALRRLVSHHQLNVLCSSSPPPLCSDCQLGRRSKLPFVNSSCTTTAPLQIIHSDVWGPTSILSVSGFKYYVLFIDDWSRFTWLFPLHCKSEVFHSFQKFKLLVENQFDTKIKSLRCDNGGEYTSAVFQSFLSNNGIAQQFSCPHTPEQNGMAERKHRHLIELTRTLFAQSSLPFKYWVEIVQTSVYLINRLPSSSLHFISPFEQLFNTAPDYNFLRAYGCLCFPWLKPYAAHKLDFRSRKCVFLGYSLYQKGYRCLDPTNGRVYVSRHVIFDENTFPFKEKLSAPQPANPPPIPSYPILLPLPPFLSEPTPNIIQPTTPTNPTLSLSPPPSPSPIQTPPTTQLTPPPHPPPPTRSRHLCT